MKHTTNLTNSQLTALIFQLKNGLTVDGICGPKTRAKLME